MRLAFIRPGLGSIAEGWNLDSGCMEPLTFAVLASLCPRDIDVVLYDDRVEDVPLDSSADAACFSVETYTAMRAYRLMDMYREAGIPVIAGGMHASLLPEEVALHADSVMVGDAESAWGGLLDDLRAKALKARYAGRLGVPQKGRLPRREIFKGKRYFPVSLVQFGRGCRFSCTYCASSAYFRQAYHARPPQEVAREIESQGLKNLIFTDDNIIADRESALALFKALKPLRLRWGGQASLDLAEDPELMDAMMESGCLGNIFGFESLSRASVESMAKAPNIKDFDRYERKIESLKDHGVFLWGAFSVGHDGDDAQTLMDTMRYTIEKKFAIASYMILVPYPNTPLYAKLARENRLLYGGKWWLSPRYRYNRAAFTPKNMSPGELEDVLRRMSRGFYSARSMLARALDPRTHLRSARNMGYYAAYNLVYRNTSIE
jgi:radical SAM superfamily enzyme YgiQ (UPF0313 family)